MAAALRTAFVRGGHTRGAAVVIDVESGEVLASVSYPWPTAQAARAGRATDAARPPTRCSIERGTGCIRPARRSSCWWPGRRCAAPGGRRRETFACVRLPDGRVGNFVRGWTRPVRDDPMDTTPHGDVDLRRGLVVSCNAYFAQLAMRLGSAADPGRRVAVPDRGGAAGDRGRAAADAAARRLRSGRRARVAAQDGARGGGDRRNGIVLPVQWTTGPAQPSGRAGRATEGSRRSGSCRRPMPRRCRATCAKR